MSHSITQPNATPLPDTLIASLAGAVAPQTGGASPSEVVFHGQHSNDVAELRFGPGRTLMVKRGRYDWTAPRFRSSRLACELLVSEAGVVAPEPIDIPAELDPQPVEAYWRVELPTLQEVWGSLSDEGCASALRSWGELIARVHDVRLHGHGPLAEVDAAVSFEVYLGADLAHRLRPAVAAEWPEGLDTLDRLAAAVPAAGERVGEDGSALLHHDLHMGNVLCSVAAEEVRCVGLIDLETAFAGAPEADLAVVEVHHGPLFGQPLDGPWFDTIRSGYGRALDPLLMRFFRAYHMLNMGFYSALVGHREHAAEVARAARREAEALDSLLH